MILDFEFRGVGLRAYECGFRDFDVGYRISGSRFIVQGVGLGVEREDFGPGRSMGRSPRSRPADRRGGAHAEAKMALLAARAAAAAAEALGGALAASFRNLGLRECATSTGASALEELQRAATASAAAAAATFRHWQDGQAAPKPSATTTGNGSSKTARRRRQRRRHQQREVSAGRQGARDPALGPPWD